MLVRQTKQISLKLIKNCPYNPAGRIKSPRIDSLARSMQEIGLLYPILIDSENTIIDGHRRFAAAKKMEWETISCVVVDGDRNKIYASVNVTASKMTGNDTLGVWLKCPTAVSAKRQKDMSKMQEILGRELMNRIYKAGLSAAIWRFATALSRYCDAENPDMICKIVEWFLENSVITEARRAMDSGENPKVLMNAIRDNKKIKMKLMIA